MSTVASAAGLGLAVGICTGFALTSPQGAALTRTLSGGLPADVRSALPPRKQPPPPSRSTERDEAIGEAPAGLVSRR
eukprot:CAMPEP_0119092638 /NCGR_PEP_ID=MMETSP1178-20130426/160394_1 /TAXON_ID=33656 /ORGANISM="unid sp, Strain CCMP2000" /LENGTH=76 /DNA_ID=CAMNT_0007076229 /DNA_START=129 /DNA_END=359 /DNA_ORIENTATION=+